MLWKHSKVQTGVLGHSSSQGSLEADGCPFGEDTSDPDDHAGSLAINAVRVQAWPGPDNHAVSGFLLEHLGTDELRLMMSAVVDLQRICFFSSPNS